MNIPADVLADDPIRESFLNSILACLRELARGPRVVAPLVVSDGVLGLASELKLYYAVVSAPIGFRSGRQLGSGKAVLQGVNSTGLLADMPGVNERIVWSDRASRGGSSGDVPIPVGTPIKIYYCQGLWNVFNGDCSGQTITATAVNQSATPPDQTTPVDTGTSGGGST